jgi:hypothetical protein
MLIRPSNRRGLVTAASFVLAQAASSVAFAQPQPSPTKETKPGEPAAETPAPPRPAEVKTGDVTLPAPVTAPAPAPASAPAPSEQPAANPSAEDTEAEKAVFFSGDIGFTRSQLGIAQSHLGFDKTGANGWLYGLLAGVRLKNLRLGIRWRVYDTTEFDLWSFAASAGYVFSPRPLTPIVSAHVGYVFDEKLQAGLFRSSIPPGNVVTPDVDLRGILAGVDVSAQYWLTKAIRLGGFVGVDAMFLHRPQVATPQSLFGPTPTFDALPLYSESANTFGLNFNVGVRGEFDIALH